jgi:hypothetical protein
MPCIQYSPIFENVADMVEKDKELSENVVMVKCNVNNFYPHPATKPLPLGG